MKLRFHFGYFTSVAATFLTDQAGAVGGVVARDCVGIFPLGNEAGRNTIHARLKLPITI